MPNHPISLRYAAAVVALASLALSPMVTTLADAAPHTAEISDSALTHAVQGAWRSPQNRARDAYRHPTESLTFWGLRPGDTVVEVEPGVKGWWTEILGPYLTWTNGTYVALLPDPSEPGLSEPVQAERKKGSLGFWEGVADRGLYARVKAYDFGLTNTTSVPASSADLVLVAREFHNWARNGDQTDIYLQAFYRILKPGGILAVEQHRAPEGADPKAGTGYVPESYVIDSAKRAGFVLDGRSEINANAKDTKDYPFGVWTLPPTRRSAPQGTAANPTFDHTPYDAVGESDRMTLRFRKPA